YSVVEEAPELPAAARMLELAQGLGLDLPDALARHGELLADFLEGMVGVHADAEAHAQHALLARRQRRQHTGRGFAQVRLDRRIDRLHRVYVWNEVAEVGIFLVADRRFEADRLLGDLQHLADFVQGHLQLFAELLGRRFAADLVQHLARGPDDLVDRLDHMHRDTDGARLVGDRTGDSLPNPPGGVGRELVAAAVLEFVDGLHQADIALLDEVQELQAAVRILLGDRDHEAKVGLDHLLLGDGRFALALLHLVHDPAVLGDVEPRFGRQSMDLATNLGDRVALALDELSPTLPSCRHGLDPAAIELAGVIGIEEVLALDAIALRKAQQPALEPHQALVDIVELLDQALDTRGIEAQRLHVRDHRRTEGVDLLALGPGDRLRPVGRVLVLQL